MTFVHNGEVGFKDQFLDGLVLAYGRFLERITDTSGVKSVSAPEAGRVSVLIGGGSGHYPAFAGLVGPGFCDGAVVGEIFTSPSSEAVYRCIRSLDSGSGVLIAFGNYSGDVMNFGLAAERARLEGIDVRIVLVTDDVASAAGTNKTMRRGVAGGFFVFRAAAAAAHAGLALGEVEAIARAVNERTVTFGVAFKGCTFPGRGEPLFTVNRGQMELGLGIHGEPGLAETPWIPASELGALLVEKLLTERPPRSERALVLLNGLGATKYEELFVLFASIASSLDRAEITMVRPEIGEFVTSLDMAGCSLTLCWIDETLEDYLDTPAASPGFRNGSIEINPAVPKEIRGRERFLERLPKVGIGYRTPSADLIANLLTAMRDAIEANESELGRLDAVAGDGDHGAGMARGFRGAVGAVAQSGADCSEILVTAGLAFSDEAGGASGAIWGAGLLAAAGAVREASQGEKSDPTALVIAATSAALEAVMRLGGASPGEKTVIDAMVPFEICLRLNAEAPVDHAFRESADAAMNAAKATAGLESRRGRSAVHGARSIGTPDPGAMSFAIAMTAAADLLEKRGGY